MNKVLIALLCFLLGSDLFANDKSLKTSESPQVLPVEGSTIAFLGNAFFERAVTHGELETTLALHWPKKKIKFRNIGWSGDTVYGHSRTGGRRGRSFGTVEEGFENMRKQLNSLKPEIIFIAYGFNESFDEDSGLEGFNIALKRLLKTVSEIDSQVILLAPTPMEHGFGAPKEHVNKANINIEKYSAEIKAVAASHGHLFIDLFGSLKGQTSYSTDGIHPSKKGYRTIAEIIAKKLFLPKRAISLNSKKAKEIRLSIVAKNQLFFHRWRPRNDAFVYGERKDEQRIAQTEPVKIEPFIAQQEAVIRNLLESL